MNHRIHPASMIFIFLAAQQTITGPLPGHGTSVLHCHARRPSSILHSFSFWFHAPIFFISFTVWFIKSHSTDSTQDVLYTRLVIRVGGEDLLLLGGNGGVPWNQHSYDSSSILQTKGEWCYIQQKKVLYFLIALTTQYGSLDSSTIGNNLIWIDALAELLPVKEVLQQLLNPKDSG